uniref:GRIP domain-containing protein n=1 Tax=Heterorhabditis bacteriophora TaxID=37862 RepID=A0A1I7XJ82_HETBA
MFKGLKSKIEDEAKKLQVSMQQYGEQLSQQVGQYRSAASDAGSDSTSISRRFLNTVGGTSNMISSPNDTISVGDTLTEDTAEELSLDLSRRERRFSGGSTRSHESSLSTFFQSVSGLAATTLDSVESDQESTVEEHSSSVFHSSSEEQITSVLSKLQGRVANYKAKYSDLIKKYNDVVNENNKCRTVLAQTQDKALNSIEKLRTEKRILGEKLKELTENCNDDNQLEVITQRYENMLEKLRSDLTKNTDKIKSLTKENQNLKSEANSINEDSGISALVTDRITAEWKQRIEKVEDEWTARINKSDSDHAIQLATTKAEMHAALEGKDKEIELWRGKCRSLEIQDGQANERWQCKVDELQLVVKV